MAAEQTAQQARAEAEAKETQIKDAEAQVRTMQEALTVTKEEAETLNKVGEIWVAKGEPDEAKQIAREVRNIYQDIGDVHGEALALQTVIAANLIEEEDFDDAVLAAKEALQLFDGRDRKTAREDTKAVADSLHTLARLHIQRGDFEQAQEYAQRAVGLYEEKGERRYGAAPCSLTLAQAYQGMEGKVAEAVTACQRAIEYYEEEKDPMGMANAMHMSALIDLQDLFKVLNADPETYTAEHNSRTEQSWSFLERALELYSEAKNEDGIAAVSETIEDAIESSRALHVKTAEPLKSIYITDPETRQTSVIHIYDTSPPKEETKKGRDQAPAQALEDQ